MLERMDRTEEQLREKLLGTKFEEEIVEQAIAYVKSYGYLDDERYVRNYISYRQSCKSRRQLINELKFKKGVSSEIIEKVCEELEENDEKELIRKYLQKKQYSSYSCDKKEKEKLMAALIRKGFCMGDILFVMKEE